MLLLDEALCATLLVQSRGAERTGLKWNQNERKKKCLLGIWQILLRSSLLKSEEKEGWGRMNKGGLIQKASV